MYSFLSLYNLHFYSLSFSSNINYFFYFMAKQWPVEWISCNCIVFCVEIKRYMKNGLDFWWFLVNEWSRFTRVSCRGTTDPLNNICSLPFWTVYIWFHILKQAKAHNTCFQTPSEYESPDTTVLTCLEERLRPHQTLRAQHLSVTCV